MARRTLRLLLDVEYDDDKTHADQVREIMDIVLDDALSHSAITRGGVELIGLPSVGGFSIFSDEDVTQRWTSELDIEPL